MSFYLVWRNRIHALYPDILWAKWENEDVLSLDIYGRPHRLHNFRLKRTRW